MKKVTNDKKRAKKEIPVYQDKMDFQLKTFVLILVQITFTITCIFFAKLKDKKEMEELFKNAPKFMSWNVYVMFGSYIAITCTRLGDIRGLNCFLSLVFNISLTWMITENSITDHFPWMVKLTLPVATTCLG